METVSAHPSLQDGIEHIFTDSLFKCKHDNRCGSAIDQSDGGYLTIQQFLLARCSSDDGTYANSFSASVILALMLAWGSQSS